MFRIIFKMCLRIAISVLSTLRQRTLSRLKFRFEMMMMMMMMTMMIIIIIIITIIIE
jgi:hypothetical protein